MPGLSIRNKFALALALIAALSGMAVYVAWRDTVIMGREVDGLYAGPLRMVDVGRATQRDFMDLRRHYLAASTMSRTRWADRYGALRRKVEADLRSLSAYEADERSSGHLRAARAAFATWQTILGQGGFVEHRARLDGLANDFQGEIDALIDLAEGAAKSRVDGARANLDRSRSEVLAGGSAAVVAGFLIMLALARNVVRPLEQAVRIADGIASGYFQDDIPLRRPDEAGRLFQALYLMREDILAQQRELERRNLQLERLAATDNLTGLGNRRKLEEFALDHIALMHRYGGSLSAILVDIDHFKSVNDTHGHAVGDQVISQISAILRQAVRESDLVGRWGGEEFLILLPNTTLDGAAILAEKIRQLVADARFPVVGGKTASFGVGQLAEGEALSGLVERADHALYRAKQEGRDTVRMDRGQAGIVPLREAHPAGPPE